MVGFYIFFKARLLQFLLDALLFWKFRKNKIIIDFLKQLDFFSCPYAISADFNRKEGKDPYSYGHTHLWTVYQIFKLFPNRDGLHVLDLGAGDFQVAFFLRKIFNFSVSGIEKIPKFCEEAFKFKDKFSISNVSIIEGDYLKIEPLKADIGFLFGSNLADEEIQKLISKLGSVDLIITVSFPLSDFCNDYETIYEKKVWFLFGSASIYIQKRKKL